MIVLALKFILAAEAAFALVLLVLLAFTLPVLSAGRRRRLEAQEAGPAIQDAVALHLGGNNDLTRLRSLARAHPEAVESSILAFQAMVGGTTRLAELALSLGFVEQWCLAARSSKVARRRLAFSRIAAVSHTEVVRRIVGEIPVSGLKDPDDQVRLEAARALVCADDPVQVAWVFDAVLQDAPLNRALLAPLLRSHAAALCQTTIPKAIGTLGTHDLLNLLRLLVSWECSLPLSDLRGLAEHPDPAVRVETMHLLARVPINATNRGSVLSGLVDRHPDVVKAAAATVRRLRLPDAIPQLTSCLRRKDPNLAQLAATLLAEMGPQGRSALEGQLVNSDPIASTAARQALESAGSGVAA